jgi:hypothetical protein
MNADMTRLYANQLRQFAEHFTPRDWNYTRDLGDLTEIRYANRRDEWPQRLRSALRWLLRRSPEWSRGWGPNRFQMAAHVLHRDNHLPDGVLDGGSIITFWEETGEYLQYVQPSVGSMLADWMEAEPDNPHAIRIAAEMKRINDSYGERIGAPDA